MKHTTNLGWLAGFALALGLLSIVAVLNWRHAAGMQEAMEAVSHTERMRAELNRLLMAMQDVETSARGYVITGDLVFREPFDAALAKVNVQFNAVRTLSQANSRQQANCAALEPIIARRIARAQAVVNLRRNAGFEAARQEIAKGEGKAAMDQVRAVIARMDAAEVALLIERSAAARAEAASAQRLTLLGTGVSFTLLIAIFALVLRENRLRQRAQAELDRFFSLSLDVLGIADVDGYFKRVNPAFATTLGWSAEEILTRPFLDLVHPDDRAATIREVEKLAAGQPTLHFENRYQCRDGSWKTLAWRAVPQPAGKIYCSGRDVTELKAAAAALRTSEEYNRAIVESSPDCLKLLSLDARLIQIGAHSCQLMEVDDFTQIKNAEWLLFWKGEEHEMAKRAVEAARAGGTGRFQGFCPTLKGTPRWWDVIVTPIYGPAGKMEKLLVVARDITGSKKAEEILRQSEERTRSIINTAYDAFIAIDTAGMIITWNTQAEATFGWSRAEALGRRLSEIIIPPQHRQAHERGLKHLNTTGHGPVLNQRLELTALHRDGREFPIEICIWPIRTGETCTFNAFLRDITERRQAEEKIKRLNADLQSRADELKTANRELESFSYSVSHDLRAPLRHIHGYVEMLAKVTEGQLADKPRRYLKTITDASVEMGQLIDDLLAFSRMGRTEMQQTNVDLQALCDETRRTLERESQGRNIVWTKGQLPFVQGDAAMLRQVLVNLLSNAVKYTRQRDPAKIEIGCQTGESGESVFYVRDNGAGFDMNYVHKLFGVFQRLHRADEFEGTGIGLATVRRIIARHGGRTWAEGKPGAGATFYFTLRQDFSAAKERTELKE